MSFVSKAGDIVIVFMCLCIILVHLMRIMYQTQMAMLHQYMNNCELLFSANVRLYIDLLSES